MTDGASVDLVYSASGGFVGEVSLEFIDTSGNILYTLNVGDLGNFNVGDVMFSTTISCPSCVPPSSPVVDNITTSDVDFSWMASTTETNGYEWVIMDEGVAVDVNNAVASGNVATGITSANATGLTENTTYDIFLRTNCGGLFSDYLGPLSFTTPCIAKVAPYAENFDAGGFDSANNTIDSCWDRNNDGSGYSWEVSTGGTLSTGTGPDDDVSGGGNYLFTEASGTLSQGDETFLNLPQVDLTALTTPSMIFFYHMYGSDTGTLSVEVKDIADVNYTEVFSISGQQQGDSGDAFIEQFVNLNSFAGQTVDIRFKGVRGDGFASDMAIDELSVDEAPSCIKPQNLATSNITQDSVDLTWDEEPLSTATDGYEWVVMASGVAPDTANAEATNTVGNGVFTANAIGLNPDTDFDAYVRSVCDAANNEVSDWSSVSSFTTLCTPFVAPSWNEDFENAGSIPVCWSQGMNNVKDWEFADAATAANHTGDGGNIGGNTASDGFFAYLDDSAPHPIGTALLSPLVDVSNLTVPQVNFYLLSNNEGFTNVDFSLDVYDGTAWNDDVFFSNSNTANGEWELIEVPISSLNITGGVIQLRFSVDENNGTDFYDDVAIDDVTVVEGPSCAKPIGLTASNVTADSVDLNWNDDPTATDGYEWVLMANGDAPDTGNALETGTVASATASIPGLTDNTSYDAYVRSICDAAATPVEVSDWSSVASFNTLCTPFSAPYSENFDGVSAPAIPSCWSTAGNEASGVTTSETQFGIDNPPSSPNFVLFGEGLDLGDGDEAILVSPQFSDLPDADKRIRFKAAFEDGDLEVHKFYVGVMSDPTDASTFVEIEVITSSLDETFSEFIVELDDASLIGSNEYIAIAGGSTANFDEIAIDDFVYEEIPTCFIPQSFTASNITLDSVDLNWAEEDPVSASEGYQWLVMASGDAPNPFNAVEAGSVGNGIFTANVNGLTPNTDYDAYVRSVCDPAGSDVSSWSSVASFSTLPDFCGGDNFFDNGGPNNNYQNGSDEVITMSPANAGDVVIVEFLSFEVEEQL